MRGGDEGTGAAFSLTAGGRASTGRVVAGAAPEGDGEPLTRGDSVGESAGETPGEGWGEGRFFLWGGRGAHGLPGLLGLLMVFLITAVFSTIPF